MSCEKQFFGVSKAEMKTIVEQTLGRPHIGLADNWRYYKVNNSCDRMCSLHGIMIITLFYQGDGATCSSVVGDIRRK